MATHEELEKDSVTPFFHGFIVKQRAEHLLADKPDGTYLVRSYTESTVNAFVLSVVFKGKPSHHLMVRERKGEPFVVNKTKLLMYTVEQVVEHLKQRRKYWPLSLTEGIKPDEEIVWPGEALAPELAVEAETKLMDKKRIILQKAPVTNAGVVRRISDGLIGQVQSSNASKLEKTLQDFGETEAGRVAKESAWLETRAQEETAKMIERQKEMQAQQELEEKLVQEREEELTRRRLEEEQRTRQKEQEERERLMELERKQREHEEEMARKEAEKKAQQEEARKTAEAAERARIEEEEKRKRIAAELEAARVAAEQAEEKRRREQEQKEIEKAATRLLRNGGLGGITKPTPRELDNPTVELKLSLPKSRLKEAVSERDPAFKSPTNPVATAVDAPTGDERPDVCSFLGNCLCKKCNPE
eukprot:m.81426 g.81426  ORF g.81426 m.81426 type:complete len:416 (-) comp14694_c0_seq2:234-1481(-)